MLRSIIVTIRDGEEILSQYIKLLAIRPRRYNWAVLFVLSLMCQCTFDNTSDVLSPPQPSKVKPNHGVNTAHISIEIIGSRFIPKATRQLTGKPSYVFDDSFVAQLQQEGNEPITLVGTTYVNNKTLTATVPPGLSPGSYDLSVTTPYGLTGSLKNAYRVVSPQNGSDTDAQGTDSNFNSQDTAAQLSCGGTAVWRRMSEDGPVYALWEETSFSDTSLTAMVGSWRIMAGANCPLRDEKIILGVNPERDISGILWNGTAWKALPFAPLSRVSSSYFWGFSVAYEQQSGDGLIVWNTGSTTEENLAFRTWDGIQWSETRTIPMSDSEEPRHMILAASPLSDEIVLVLNKNGADWALVWDGDSWGNILKLDDSSGDTDIFVAYEQTSGRAMVVFGKAGHANGYYRLWSGSEWSEERPITPPFGEMATLRWSTLASDPKSNRLAFGAITHGLATRSHIWLKIWDGNGWIAPQNATKDQTDNVNYPNLALSFESTTDTVLAAYTANTTTNRVNYRTWTSSGQWSAQLDGPETDDNANTMMLYSRPDATGTMLLAQTRKKTLQALYYKDGGWSLPAVLEDDTGETKNQPFVFFWESFCP